MDILKDIISLGTCVYKQCETMQDCKKQCQRLRSRIQGLLQPLQRLQAQGERNLSTEMTTALSTFQAVLKEAKKQVDDFSNKSYVHKILTSRKDKRLFKDVNRRLNDVLKELSLLLQVYPWVPSSSINQEARWEQEDQQDAEEDWQVFQSLTGSENIEASLEQLKNDVKKIMEANMKKIIETSSHSLELFSGKSPLGRSHLKVTSVKVGSDGYDSKKIYQLVAVDRYQEPLGEDCPSQLQEIIDDCRAYEPFQRPSVNGILEKLSIFYKAAN
uniref:Mixed lineage kinase domain like pseudokinase n=1 Tax=Molossus molossus TaxID=27622 RepID=A0A7J8C9C8_MOLMO|nr:mixed lineage kinase domain like pseudokinase [Molossus molossus]